ncbi:MAG: hypothetical protein U0031_16305 [Thermomicrobiales bacterium]
MSEGQSEGADLQWRSLLEQVANGQTVEIQCADEGIAERRATQASRRATKAGMNIQVSRAGNIVRLSPPHPEAETPSKKAERQQAKAERQAKREKLRKSSRAGRPGRGT